MLDVVCLGELLIDFTTKVTGASIIDSKEFIKHAGGSPANTAVGVATLGGNSALMGKVGDDPFGKFLYKTLKEKNVNVSGLRLTKEAKTRLAFVDNLANGKREFIFYGTPSADELYCDIDLEHKLLLNTKIFHFGSIALVNDCVYKAAIEAISLARGKGVLISYDPNVRLDMWPNESMAKERITECIRMSDIVKISDEELEISTGTSEIEEALEIVTLMGPKIAIVTRGDSGVDYKWGAYRGYIPSFKVDLVDATGAGDSFAAALLFQISKQNKPIDSYDDSLIRGVIAFAAKVGAIVVTKHGAIPAMPTFEEVSNSF